MIQFIYGLIIGIVFIIGIAVLDVKIFKDKLIIKKFNDFRAYLFYTGIEVLMFIMGYLVGLEQ